MTDNRWDLTTRKRASRKYNIINCPVCGRYGQLVTYIDKDRTPKFAGMVKHKGHIEAGMFNMIDDSCTLNLEQVNALEAKEVA
jgi:C4-type Zn-finger protein